MHIVNYEKRLVDVQTAKSLKEDGLGATEIGRKMGLPESTVRSLLNPKSEDRMNQVMETVDFLRKQLEEKGMIDVGAGVEQELNISRTRLDTALDYLEKAEGCPVYGGDMKALANKARVEIANSGKIAYKAEAKNKYQAEVKSLDDKLTEAQKNRPKEREALRRANVEIQAKIKANPDAKKEDIKKWKQQAVTKYRAEVGSVKRSDRNINITDKEWEAIQAGAISETKLKDILNNTDIDKLRERATPKLTTSPSSAQIARIKAMSASNYTLAEIAKKTGFSTATVSK